MITGKTLLRTLTSKQPKTGVRGMAAAFEKMCRSLNFPELDTLTAIARLVKPEYNERVNKRVTNRLRIAHLLGCSQKMGSCVGSANREYLPSGIKQALSTRDFVKSGMNVCALGPFDSGKSYLAKAVGIKACSKYRVGVPQL